MAKRTGDDGRPLLYSSYLDETKLLNNRQESATKDDGYIVSEHKYRGKVEVEQTTSNFREFIVQLKSLTSICHGMKYLLDSFKDS